MKSKNNLLILFILCLGNHFALALPEDKDLPIQITSKEASYDQNTGIGIYKTQVVVTQGTLEIKADLATLYMINDQLDKVIASGKPITMKYLPEKNKPWIYGEGLNLHYDPKTGLVTVTGNAKFIQDKDTFTADKVEYDAKNNKVKAYSNTKETIKFIIQPKPKGTP